jgi:hypothetical protein
MADGSKVSISIPADLRERVIALAEQERRSFSNTVTMLLDRALKIDAAASAVREALDRRRPYPVTKEAPADADGVDE